MQLHRIWAIVLRHFYLLRGSPARVMPLFVWVIVDMVLWGFLTRYLNSVVSSGFNFVPAFLGAVLLWDFFIRVMQGVTLAFFEDVWSRNFLNFFATPLAISEYVSGLVLSSIGTSLVGLAAMLVLATAVFGLSFAAYGALAIPYLLVLFLFGIALGVCATAFVLRFGPAAEWFIWPIPALIAPFAAVYYPVATLPAWMRGISRVLPPSYVFESLRALLGHHPAPPGGLATSLLLAILYVLLASWMFSRIYRHAVRTGLIARYSAESLS